MQRSTRVVAVGIAVGLLLPPVASAGPLDKLGGQLRDLATGKRMRAKPAAPSVQPLPVTVRGGKALVDVYVKGAMRDGAAALRNEGMRVEAISGRSPERMVEGWVPVSALDDVARLRRTKAVLPVYEPIFNTGGTNSEGDAVHRGPQVRAMGFTGAGVPVGVISDSINRRGGGVAGSQASGDLPANVQILDDSGPGSTDEGRAMAEIVYDTAPGIPRIIFSRGGGGAATRVNSIDALVAAGAKVIVDDVAYLSEPFFQDGIVAQAADRAKANDVAYLVSAGNRGRQSWEGTFTPTGSPALNDFDPGAGTDTRQTVATVPAGQQLSIFVQWDEPFDGATTDFALDFYNANTSVFIGTINSPGGVPMESAALTGASGGTTFAMEIRRVSGTGTPHLKWIANGSFTGSVPAEFANSQAIDPDAASARGTLAVAAVRHNDAGLDTVESFSSRGPAVTRFLDPSGVRLATPDVRPKPDVAGADGVATSIDGPPTDYNPFFGTSAAAPSAAGVAVLLRSARPSLTVDQVYAIMKDPRGSIDCTSASGFPDADCGFGFLLADGKLNMALDPSPPAVTAVLSPGAPDGANGWFHSDVALSWNVSEPDSPLSLSGCDPRSIATDGVVTLTCTAVSPGGTTSQPVSIKRDSVPPDSPTFTGIGPGASFTTRNVPAQDAIRCAATDATSGVTSCVVGGYSASVGRHTLSATATDESGLVSGSTLTYSVRRARAAARRLKLARRQSIRSVLRSGLKCTLRVATNSTALSARLKVGRTTVGRLKTTKNRGTARLRIRLSRAGKRKLRPARRARFALAIRATSPAAIPATLRASRTLRR